MEYLEGWLEGCLKVSKGLMVNDGVWWVRQGSKLSYKVGLGETKFSLTKIWNKTVHEGSRKFKNKMVQDGSRKLKKAQEKNIRFENDQIFKKVQEGLRRFMNVHEFQKRNDSKSFNHKWILALAG